MNVNYEEYNSLHLPIADNLVCFIKGLHHAMQKTNDFEGAMHQLKCIGYEKALETVERVAYCYKEYHKNRIRAEQTANLPEVLYPTIDVKRRPTFVKNLELIERIRNHEDFSDMCEAIEDAIVLDATTNAENILLAYQRRDVDALFSAICGYSFEEICACATIIPDVNELFRKKEDCCEVFFPLYGKETLTVEEFKEYILSNYEIHDDTWKLIQSAIRFAATAKTQEAKQDCLWTLLKDSIGIPEEVVRMVQL